MKFEYLVVANSDLLTENDYTELGMDGWDYVKEGDIDTMFKRLLPAGHIKLLKCFTCKADTPHHLLREWKCTRCGGTRGNMMH